ncbi:6-O-methylguanine DNA methyltransferase [Amylibacter kogurei]|uniref:methylated-DNA--[protein]-cysteine S-methyltransferase n=1 Tax=Paramylibacter kogurei TaxID=1889778 RepID=A0A2G5K9S2_9RHOB|nr:trifunctional transcriptional activator/DNA repair protein Ada/methylated-DNA--[protein]-cysteine S-methyltransferase [Amylibacter kogurei]PIB26185.1 6-O-methylguanine DNA methyltransferase [Amylibacter kogurei]
MLYERLNPDILYTALVARDPSYDGRAFVGVTSTGIFCRLTCPARKPLRKNCQFFETVSDCVNAGFRACKRCHPMTPMADADPAIIALMNALENRPHYRWTENDIIQMGFDPSTVRRAFKRHFGQTFLEMARQRRLSESFTTLSDGGRIIDAQIDAGFESASAFRTAFAKLMGKSPANFAKDAMLKADWNNTPLGPMIAVSCSKFLHLLEFIDRKALPKELQKLSQQVRGDIGIGTMPPSEQIREELTDFFAGKSAEFRTPVAMHGTPFMRSVWRTLREIPAGQTRSYSQIARTINAPNAVRAVARANGANQIALLIPCHRVIGADGSLTGYGGGLWRKQRLIEIETLYNATKAPET